MLLQQFPGDGLGGQEARIDPVGKSTIEGKVTHRDAGRAIEQRLMAGKALMMRRAIAQRLLRCRIR